MTLPTPQEGTPTPQTPQEGNPTPPAPIEPPAPAPVQNPAPAPAPAPNPAPVTFDANYVTALRNEAAEGRVKSRQFDELNAKFSALEAQNRTLSLTNAISRSAVRLADPADALKFIDQAKIVYDEKTQVPTNLDELLTELVTAKPYLAGTPGQGPNEPTNPQRAGAKFTIEQIKTMSPEEINANWEEVRKVMAQ